MFLEQTQKALENLRKIIPPTPLQYSTYLSQLYDANIYLKREDLTPVRSYKIRGAFNFISQLTDIEKNNGVVCASAGNHAQGFAFSCVHYKIKGTVFMPVTTPQQKIEKTRLIGGNFIKIELVGDIFDEAAIAAKEFCEKQNATLVPPFDHEKIIEGQATIGLEILNQIELSIDKLLIPVGGGGVSAGVSELFKEKSPQTNIYCTEPKGAPSLKESLKNKKNTTLDKVDCFVDGAAVKRIGESNFKILQKNITKDVILIPENRLCQTMLDFLFYEGIVLEPAGGLSIDALKHFHKNELKGKTIVCIVSGGNFDFERLPDIKERAMKYAGLKKYFILRLPQRPGALKEFLSLIGDNDDISRFEYLKKSARNFGSVLIGIETTQAENFEILFEKMKKSGFDYQDVTKNEILADFII